MSTTAITTERLSLRPYYAGLVTDDHVRWLNDPEVVKYSEQRHQTHTIESIHAYVNDLATNPNAHIWGIFVVGSTSSCCIGTITAYVDPPNGVANVGILIGEKNCWGMGFGREAWNAVCNWLFDKRDIRKIEMGCHYENRPMRDMAERCGMTLEGVRHDHFVVNGEPQHLLLYAKMRPVSAKVTVDARTSSQSVRKRNRQSSTG